MESQLPSGGFTSFIWRKNKATTDVNTCITALVLRQLLRMPGLVNETVIENAFRFLKQCASRSKKGCYNFYPPEVSANPLRIPDDADDTALITLLLLQSEQLSKQSLIRDTCVSLDQHRVFTTSLFDPPWINKGAYYTWLDHTKNKNIVDCCVNANVVALYAYAGLQHLRGYAEACELISNAVIWAGHSAKRFAAITPFYNSQQELYYAVEHAVNMGAVSLTNTLQFLDWAKPDTTFESESAICCSAYGNIKWYCPLLQKLRSLV